MQRRFSAAAIALIVVACTFHSTYALIGIGVQYGLDYTLNMKDKFGDSATLDNLKLNVAGATGGVLSGKEIPILIDRSGWKAHPFNVGGKLYVDCIPLIDALELSGNYAMWEYIGKIHYPKTIAYNAGNTPPVSVVYDSTTLTLDNLGLSNPFLKNTPYAKLQLDLTIKKYLVQLAMKTLRFYGGAGFTLQFATPIISGQLIQDALGDKLDNALDVSALPTLFDNTAIMQEIWNKLFTPHYGCHIDLGAMVKIPVIPIAIYVDGKYVIMFTKQDPSVDLGGDGLMVNMGIALHF